MAESFGIDPERYDRARPRYPDEVLRRVLASAPGRAVLDVGCGTGIEGRQLVAAGCTVLGIDPDPRMAAFARARGLTVEVSTFEGWDAAGRTFDAVVAGTSWHWVEPVAGAAAAAAVLRPGGVLVPFGHVYQLPGAVAEALATAYRRAAPDSLLAARADQSGSMLDAYGALYERAADGVRRAGGFGEPEVWRHDWEHHCSTDELCDLIATSGGITALPPPTVAEVLAPVTEAVRLLAGAERTLTIPYATWG